MPNLVTIVLLMNLTTVEALISTNASASTHLVKYSVAVRIKDFFLISPVVSSKGPIMSKAHMAKGQGVETGWREDEGAWILLVWSSHFTHLRINSAQSISKVGQ